MIQLKTINTFIYMNHDQKIIWIRIPKCASSSIHDAIISSTGINFYDKDIKYTIDKAREDYFSFCFVRNPFDRLVSCYSDRVQRMYNNSFGSNSYDTNAFVAMGLKPNISFEKFVDIVCEQDDNNSDHHWRSQWTFMTKNGSYIHDFIGHIENIQKDWDLLCDIKGWKKTQMPKKKVSKHNPYKEFYTPKLIKKIRKRYEKDLDLFGYTFRK